MGSQTNPEPLKALESCLASLRPISPYVLEIIETARKDDVSLLDLGRRLSFDPAISAHLLKACRSAAYGIQCPIKSPLHAVALLGAERVVQIVLSVTVREQMGIFLGSAFEHEIWEHSLAVAFGVQSLIRFLNSPISLPEGFTAGLFHDLGKLIIHRALGGDPALAKAQLEGGRRGLSREEDLCGLNHVQVIERLLEKWALSPRVKEAITEHHLRPEDIKTPLGKHLLWAHCLVKGLKSDCKRGGVHYDKPLPSSLTEDDSRRLCHEIKQELEAISCFF
ncbi:HDOD domain-containing protein [Thermosulfuriphilus sp.]